MVIDFHAHIFPQRIAARAAQNIGAFYGGYAMRHAGGAEELLSAMDAGGLDRSLVHSVALSPAQVSVINDFIIQTVDAHPGRLYGYATMHPDFERPGEEIARALSMGLKGVKMHSDMQQISLADPRMEAIYTACEGVCPLLLHTGDSRFRYDNPSLIPPILKRHPRLTLVCAHMGGYSEWESARELLADANVYVDTSSSYFALGDKGLLDLIRAFGACKVLFGSDFPMWDPGEELRAVRGLGLTSEELALILHENALSLIEGVKS